MHNRVAGLYVYANLTSARSDTAGGMYPSLGPSELLVRTDDAARAMDALAHAAVALT